MFYKIIVVLAVSLLVGCSPTVQTSSTQQGPKESTGALSGMIIGGDFGFFVHRGFGVAAGSWTTLPLPSRARLAAVR